MRQVPNTKPEAVALATGAALAASLLYAVGKIAGFLVIAFIFKIAWNMILPHALPTQVSEITYWQSFWTLIMINLVGIAFLTPLKEIKTTLSTD